MKELHIEKEITLEQINEHWFELEDPYTADEDRAIDFNMPCADWFSVFSEEFKNVDEFHEWLEDDDNQMNSNLLYYHDSNQLLMMFEFCTREEYNYSYITIKDGPGKDKLIQMCEECCQSEYGQSCNAFLSEEEDEDGSL